MSELTIIQNKTCAITGHRTVLEDLNKEELKNLFIKVIKEGYDTFLIGMAVGFDTVCFNVLKEIRKTKKVRLIACIPCLTQDIKFNLEQKKEYKKLIEEADEKIVLSENYTPKCMFLRNKFMVDNSSLLIAYLRTEKGGTFNTYSYAKRKGINIIKV